MTLRLTDRGAFVTCPDTFASTGDKTRSSQHPIPCPVCRGSKQVWAGTLPRGESR